MPVLSATEACGCAVRVRSDRRGHAVQVRDGEWWGSVTNGAGRVSWCASKADAEELARRVLFGLVTDALRDARTAYTLGRSKAKREAARELCFAATEWLAEEAIRRRARSAELRVESRILRSLTKQRPGG